MSTVKRTELEALATIVTALEGRVTALSSDHSDRSVDRPPLDQALAALSARLQQQEAATARIAAALETHATAVTRLQLFVDNLQTRLQTLEAHPPGPVTTDTLDERLTRESLLLDGRIDHLLDDRLSNVCHLPDLQTVRDELTAFAERRTHAITLDLNSLSNNVDVLSRRTAAIETRRAWEPSNTPRPPDALSSLSRSSPDRSGSIPTPPTALSDSTHTSSGASSRIKAIAYGSVKFSGIHGKDDLTSAMFLQYFIRRCPSTYTDADLLENFPLFLAPGSPAASWFATTAAISTTLNTFESMGPAFIREFPVPTPTEIRALIQNLRLSPELRPLNLLSKVAALHQQASRLVTPSEVFNIVLNVLPPSLKATLQTDPSYQSWMDSSPELSITGGLGKMLSRAQELLIVRPDLAVYPPGFTDPTPVIPASPTRPLGVHLVSEPIPVEQKDHAPAIMGLQQSLQSLADRVDQSIQGPPHSSSQTPSRRDDSRSRDPSFPRDSPRHDRDFPPRGSPDSRYQKHAGFPDNSFRSQAPDRRADRSESWGPPRNYRPSSSRDDPVLYRDRYAEKYAGEPRERQQSAPRDRFAGDSRRPPFPQSRIAVLGNSFGDYDGAYADDIDDFPPDDYDHGGYFEAPPHGPPDEDAFRRP